MRARISGHDADRVKGRAEFHAARDADPSVGWAQAVEIVVHARNPDRPAGVSPEANVSQIASHGCRRAARRPARHTVRRHRVARRAIVQVLPHQRTGQLVRDGLAHDGRACVEQRLHRWRGLGRGLIFGGPIKRAAGCRQTFHVEQILDRQPQALQRAIRCALDGVVQNKGVFGDAIGLGHGFLRLSQP